MAKLSIHEAVDYSIFIVVAHITVFLKMIGVYDWGYWIVAWFIAFGYFSYAFLHFLFADNDIRKLNRGLLYSYFAFILLIVFFFTEIHTVNILVNRTVVTANETIHYLKYEVRLNPLKYMRFFIAVILSVFFAYVTKHAVKIEEKAPRHSRQRKLS